MLSGILNLNKPSRLTSTVAVRCVKRLLPRGIKVGHAGTLDAFAEGVLLILIGRATRMSEQLMNHPKQYVATLQLGATTPTHDPDSPAVAAPDAYPVTSERLQAALQKQVGLIQQVPPAYSALKVGGMRSSDRIRAGQTIPLCARPVRIDAIELLDYRWPVARIKVDCGRGTYIRALARDIGDALGVGAYLTTLRRTRVGDFRLDQSVTLEQLTRDNIGQFLTTIV